MNFYLFIDSPVQKKKKKKKDPVRESKQTAKRHAAVLQRIYPKNLDQLRMFSVFTME